MVVVAFIGWLISGVLPIPPAANDSPAEVVAFYGEHPTAVRAGLLLAAIGVSFVAPLCAVISVQMLRMEGAVPILSFLQLLLGAVTAVMLLVPMLFLNIAAFRPDRNPELTVMLNDAAWLMFLTPIAPFILQNVVIGYAVLEDRTARGVFPRWVGFANLWIGFMFVPACLAYFFTSGPFAWHGIFVFWFGLTFYAVWAFLMWWAVRQAVRKQIATERTVVTKVEPEVVST
ncbi:MULTISPECIES: hypothetical protein [unclassified Pseudonocardia]|uniref:hypothetical protein n=1 Tax=unclassified Pseudonocardia TaxID=2619320 RepID=UPI0011AE47DB|nr:MULTISPECIES: hypothetical protein [unclassified Pseudonocardia]